MDSFEVILTPDATADLLELRDYIAESIAPVPDEPWHSRGLRKITAKNFYVYYRIDENSKHVYVMNVIYTKCDQLKHMKKMKF